MKLKKIKRRFKRMKTLIPILLLLFLSGCGYNPASPHLRNFTSFYGFLNEMDSLAKVSEWIDKKTEYKLYVAKKKSNGDHEVQRHARYLFYTKKGVCIHQSSMFVYASTWHGKEAGIVIMSNQNNEGHTYAWVKENGTIALIDGTEIKYNAFPSVEAMANHFNTMQGTDYYIFDHRMEKLLFYMEYPKE
jgi:hypothetical protein